MLNIKILAGGWKRGFSHLRAFWAFSLLFFWNIDKSVNKLKSSQKKYSLWSSKKWIKVEPGRDDSAKPEVVEASYDHGAEGQGHGQYEAAVVVGVLADQVDAAYQKTGGKILLGTIYS